MKFITDTNLGKLAKWLRILGYDTILYTGIADRDFLRKAGREGRFVLTRKKDMSTRQFSGKLIRVECDHVEDQLAEVMDKLSISPDANRMFSICVKCNQALETVEKGDILGMVPAFVYDTHGAFRRCPLCKGIFWPGTHVDNVINYLDKHTRRHHP